jgi:hypothetical protein
MKVTKEQQKEIRKFILSVMEEMRIIYDLCKEERHDINYGFVLGQMYNNISNQYYSLHENLDSDWL